MKKRKDTSYGDAMLRLFALKVMYDGMDDEWRKSDEGVRVLNEIKELTDTLNKIDEEVGTLPCERSYGDAIKYLMRRRIYKTLDWLCLCLTFICFALVGYVIGSYVVQHEWFGVFAFLLIGLLVAACLYMQIKEINL